MSKLSIIATTAVTGIVIAASAVSPALAWHPEGVIVKQVQNVTAGTAMGDANTAANAVAAKPGDTLKYTLTISNPAPAAQKSYNDLAFVNVKDSLPAGVELVGNPSLRHISEDLGTVLPGKSITKTLTVKVTATADGIIENKACFTGNSVVKDAPRSGCDKAYVKVTVPAAVAPTVTPPAPIAPAKTPAAPAPAAAVPAELPKAGPTSIVALVAAASAVGYALNVLRLKRSFGYQR